MKLKILYVTGALTWRGGEQQLINLFWPLQHKGHEQMILCARGSVVENYCRQHNIRYVTYKKSGGLNFAAPLLLKKLCTLHKIDILYLNDPDAHTMGYVASFLGLTTPTILTRKKVLPVRNSFFTIKKYNAAFIRYIICVSTAVKEILSERVVDTSKLVVIHEGIEPPDEKSIPPFELPAHITQKNFDALLGYTAAITSEKDHDTFLRVADALVHKHNLHLGFIIAGDGNLKQEVEEKIRQMNLSENVFLSGFINNVPSLLKRLDILLFTSRSEAFSISILESFFLKVPVISTNWKGVQEMVRTNDTGLLSEMGDVDDLVKNVLLLLNDAQLKNQLVENAYNYVQQYNCNAMADKIEQVFYKTLAEEKQ